MSLTGLFYGEITIPTATSDILPPAGQFAFFIDNADNNFKKVDSAGVVTNITLGQVPGITALTDGANIAVDASVSKDFSVTLTDNRIFDNPTGMKAGDTITFLITQDATGTRVATWGSKYFWVGGTDGVLSTGANARDIVIGYCDGTNLIMHTLVLAVAV